MPPLTRWFIKASFVSLTLAFVVRATMAALPFWDLQAGRLLPMPEAG